ncbi:class I SAM-dependent methyltransferase [Litorivicinus sp.]|nr:class I SAM-dependent methyltransferase [Litorivicinus sp.]
MAGHEEYSDYLQRRSWLGYLYRQFILYPKLNSYLIGNTLDVGCGIGDFLSYKQDAIGVDINRENVNYCINRGLNAVLMQPNQLPFENSAFDNVILDNVLEHIEDPMPTLSEIYRVTNKKGYFLVGVPGRKGYFSDGDHKIFYDEASLRNIIESVGFTLKKIFFTPFSSTWLDRNARQYCLYGLFSK